VEVPLALPLLIEGVRAAAVLVIGIAAVVAFIGVGTLGVLVFEGFGQQANDHILLGAVPMVVLAVAVDAGLRWLQRVAVSPGIRREIA
jgi:osmoprotectant transport system permease protein